MTPTTTGARPFDVGIRTLGFADGPHEVHNNALANAELRKLRKAR